MINRTVLTMFALLLCLGCDSGSSTGDSGDAGGDGDTDTDSDTDGDVDTDCSGDGVCDNPPDDECTEDGNKLHYTGEATCIDDECHYSYVLSECPWGCEVYENNPYHPDGGDCIDPCDGVVCDDPPDGQCESPYDDQDIAYNYNYPDEASCNVDDEGNPFCYYGEIQVDEYCWHDVSAAPKEYCQVIDGVAQCVEE